MPAKADKIIDGVAEALKITDKVIRKCIGCRILDEEGKKVQDPNMQEMSIKQEESGVHIFEKKDGGVSKKRKLIVECSNGHRNNQPLKEGQELPEECARKVVSISYNVEQAPEEEVKKKRRASRKSKSKKAE